MLCDVTFPAYTMTLCDGTYSDMNQTVDRDIQQLVVLQIVGYFQGKTGSERMVSKAGNTYVFSR